MHFFQFLRSNHFSRYVRLVFLLWDFVLLNSSYLLSIFLRFGDLNRLLQSEVKTIFLLTNGLWLFLVLYHEAYKIIRVEHIEALLSRTLKLMLIHSGIIAGFVVILKYDQISRLRMFYFYVIFFTLLFVFRIVFLKILKFIRAKGYNSKNVLIVGANKTGNRMVEILLADLSYGYNVIGFADNEKDNQTILKAPLLGDLQEIESIVNKNRIDEMYVALDIKDASQITRLINICEQYMIRIKLIPDFQLYTKTRKVIIDFYDNMPVLMLRKEPLGSPLNRTVKFLFDKLFSLFVILCFFTWFFPIIILVIRFTTKGPVFYKQIRSGENNNYFTCYKFRSMRNDNGSFIQATKNDPRITKIGSFMRKTNIDELPQFFNVFLGQMSIVGPRPHPIELDQQYHQMVESYLVRHYAKPGITGWAQVNGYRGETKRLEDMQRRVDFDIWYIENWSFLLDIKIIWRTLKNMIFGDKNAY